MEQLPPLSSVAWGEETTVSEERGETLSAGARSKLRFLHKTELVETFSHVRHYVPVRLEILYVRQNEKLVPIASSPPASSARPLLRASRRSLLQTNSRSLQ